MKINKDDYIKDFNILMNLAIERTQDINEPEYNKYFPLMYDLKENIGNVYIRYLELFVSHTDIKSLITFDGKYNFRYNKAIELLQHFPRFIYDNNFNLLPLSQQNENCKKYLFDFSSKRPKTLNM